MMLMASTTAVGADYEQPYGRQQMSAVYCCTPVGAEGTTSTCIPGTVKDKSILVAGIYE